MQINRMLLGGSLLLALLLAPLVFAGAHMSFNPAPQTPPSPRASSEAPDFKHLALVFAPVPDASGPASYQAQVPGGAFFFAPEGVTFVPAPLLTAATPAGTAGHVAAPARPPAVHLQFVAANAAPGLTAADALMSRVNYLRGSDPAGWQTDLPAYGHVTYAQLYPGIALSYAGTDSRLKGTYTVAAGADPDRIRWRYPGSSNLQVTAAGDLRIREAGAAPEADLNFTEQAPQAWQDTPSGHVSVAVHYVLAADGTVGFALAPYNHALPLIIDPILTYSTYLGGSALDEGHAVAVDTSGNIYVVGVTESPEFPVVEPLQGALHGPSDVFVTKFNAEGQVLYSTYLGGAGDDNGVAIAVDGAGNAVICGQTTSRDFPHVNALQPTYGGGPADAFVAKLSANGSTLLFATYLGGLDGETAHDLAVDSAGSVYVTGETTSTDFPVLHAFQSHPANPGGSDAFITRITATGTLAYSTYLGGNAEDLGWAIAVDSSGAAYITGQTGSSDFPVLHPFQPANGGASNAFVSKLSPAGDSLVYSTYLGGNRYDYGFSLAVDAAGSAYVSGYTDSDNFPTRNAYQPASGGLKDAFVTKFTPDGTGVSYSTYLGGSRDDIAYGITVDQAGDAYVTGNTASPDFPVLNPLQAQFAQGAYDAFVTVLDGSGQNVLYSTFLGGGGDDGSGGGSLLHGRGIAVDAAGTVYLAGGTTSIDFPLADPYQPQNAGLTEAFVARILGGNPSPTPTSTGTPPTPVPTSTPTSTPPVAPSATPTHTPRPPAPTRTPTATPTNTPPPPSDTPTATPTNTPPPPSNTPTPGQPTPCPVQFTDVPPDSPFYSYIRCLTCRGIVSGYADETFRPNNSVTRGQMAKFVANAAGYNDPIPPTQQTFRDVTPTNPFWLVVERAYAHGIISGYDCGAGCLEFRPNNTVTRGQTAKFVSNAAGFRDDVTGRQTFRDVPASDPFWLYVERVYLHGVISGYTCGDTCLEFRPGNAVTRGQTAKFISNTFFPDCLTPRRLSR